LPTVTAIGARLRYRASAGPTLITLPRVGFSLAPQAAKCPWQSWFRFRLLYHQTIIKRTNVHFVAPVF